MDEPFFGYFLFNKPFLMIKDLDLIKKIMIEDSNHFADHHLAQNIKQDPVGSNQLVMARGEDWKKKRSTLRQFFSTPRLKNIFNVIKGGNRDLIQTIEESIKNKEEIDVKNMFSRFDVQLLTSCCFGLRADTFNSSAFFKAAVDSLSISNLFGSVIISLFFVAPQLVEFFGLRWMDEKSSQFFRELFWHAVEERERTKEFRDDLIDMLIKVKDSSTQKNYTKDKDGDELVAHATSLLTAGFDTSSNVSSFMCYELARNPDIQNKLRAEILEIKRNKTNFDYEDLNELKYMDKCFKETLRLYPALPFLDRYCNKSYRIPGTDKIIEKGLPVHISLMGIHYDEKYWKDPYTFDPERFSEENIADRPSMVFLPFGEGPRHCVGKRLGVMSVKSVISEILSNYEILLCSKTKKKREEYFHPFSVFMQPKDGLFLQFQKLESQ